jgi:hypothetical protein
MPVRYSQLDYMKPLIVNGSMQVADMPFDRLQSADLVVAVQGDRIRVVKDRYGPTGDITKPQLDDIRALDPEVIDVRAQPA